MPSIKIYPPTPLPDRNVSETQFNIWSEELEVYLSQEKDFAIFLPGGNYGEWISFETSNVRIAALKANDVIQANAANRLTADQVQEQNDERLVKRQRDLRTVLSIVGKCVSQGHYNSVVRHSTSLQWIYNTLRCDYDIQQKGIHFFNILDLKYDSQTMTPVSFYNQYRTLISNNLAKSGDSIKYKDNLELTEDEKMTPMLEDLVLMNVIGMIDSRLPVFVRSHYNHKMKNDDKLMDFKADIFVNIPNFLESLDMTEQNNSIKEEESATLNAFRQRPKKKPQTQRNRFNQQSAPASSSLFCVMCFKEKLPKEIYTSHNLGDLKCTQISKKDRERLIDTLKLSVIKDFEFDKDEEDMAEILGYTNFSGDLDVEVTTEPHSISHENFSRIESARLSFIRPVSSQILTVFQDNSSQSAPIHIDLDTGATVNYVTEKEVLNRGFKVYPNGQLSKLGDGKTKLKSIGEIHETFFRNNWTVKFSAIVCRQLTSPFIGGTVFMRHNGVMQDLVKNVIHVHNQQITVQPTDPVSLLPTAPLIPADKKVVNKQSAKLLSLDTSRTLLPGQEIEIPVQMEDGETVLVEPWEQNKNISWPEPHLQSITGGKINLVNSSNNAIMLGREIKKVKIRQTSNEESSNVDPSFYSFSVINKNIQEVNGPENVKLISQSTDISDEAKEIIDNAHSQFSAVFDKDLSKGYNAFYGKHECHLNWASSERPPASKVRVPNYDHDLRGLQQELMDELTRQKVLLVPQEHDIKVQSVCPSFIQRKQRAKDKPKNLLTKDDVRLLINFGPVNDKIKPLPLHVPKTDDILITMGRWRHIIIFDLYNGYFQNHMSKDSIPWLGVQTPFGGLRVIARSGQGLLGMAEEFDELLSKVLKEELKEGIACKIVGDVYVGGSTQEEAAVNYVRILAKLSNANLKITPEKTKIFPKTADVLGWIWSEGGFLEASPHRKIALSNTKTSDITKVKDMRSWLGLFKTLHIATPKIHVILSPFEQAVAGKDTNEKFEWTHELEASFREAKKKINSLIKLYLPAPDDQLLLETDAANGRGNDPAGIGHILYAIKNKEKLPVRFHSVKLPDKCKKWSPCEIEALAFAVGIEKEYDLIRESKHPLIVCPDSKPVHEAVKMINEGKFSASARMSSFLTNVNKTKIETRHISGKAKLNPISDLQSRNPAECSAEFCSIHKFIDTAIDSIIDPGAKNNKISEEPGFSNREAWKAAQESNQACSVAKQLLMSGKPPPKAIGKNTGEYWNDVRHYCREATIARDGLLVVKSQPEPLSGNVNRERIVIPKPLVPSLLYHLHNHRDQHPVKSQQKSTFQRLFFAVHLDKHLDLLYKHCYKCAIVQRIPKQLIQNESKTTVRGPQTHFHADVIKRASQNILTVRDHFSSYQDAGLIPSEKAAELKEGLINLTSTMRRPGEIFISVDNSPGFKTLLTNQDEDLKKLHIVMVKTDEINKNANAVIDKGCRELEEEIKQLEPEGRKITSSTLKLAILNLNSKLRRRGNISSFEINVARDQNTGENLKLDDQTLRSDQLQTRKTSSLPNNYEPVEIGDTVVIKNENNKHKAREMFIVTDKTEETNKVNIQKLLHPLLQSKGKLMAKSYKTDEKRLRTVHRPEFPANEEEDDVDDEDNPKQTVKTSTWNPVNLQFFNDSSDDEETEPTDVVNPVNIGIEIQQDNNGQQNENIAEYSQTDSDNDLQWDDSPEQIILQADSGDEIQALLPRNLFSDDNDDEVFTNFHTPLTSPQRQHRRKNAARPRNEQIVRQNAFRRERPVLAPTSEPRITRSMARSRVTSSSAPASPSQVILDRPQDLGNVLRPRAPIVPESVVVSSRVQRIPQSPRRSARSANRDRVDYASLHKYGK